MTEPDLTTEIIGYRQWYVTPELKLRAAHKTTQEWAPGANTAKCERQVENRTGGWRHKPCKDTPGSDCECGFYALHDPSDFWYGRQSSGVWGSITWSLSGDDPLVSGVIAGWGKIQVHYGGFRAEHARIVALALPEGKRDAAVVRAVAAEYGVPCVPVDDLPKIAAEFGIAVPGEMRPEKPEPKIDDAFIAVANRFWAKQLQPSSNWWHHTNSNYTILDPSGLWVSSSGYASGGKAPTPTKPQTRNPITKREPANRQGPHAGRKRPPRDLGGKGR